MLENKEYMNIERTDGIEKVESTSQRITEAIREGFDRFEEKFHRNDKENIEKSENTVSFVDLCEVVLDDIEKMICIVDTYIEEKIARGIDIDTADADEMFNDKEFIELLKDSLNISIMPAICYWNILKTTFSEYQNLGKEKSAVNNEKSTHEKKVRAVTEMLIACIPEIALARMGYVLITGHEADVIEKIDANISEKLVAASDATLYLAANLGIVCLRTVENAIEFSGAAIETAINNKEEAEKLLDIHISDDLKDKLDEAYGKENWVKSVGDAIDKFGVTATYLGLTILMAGNGPVAIAGGATLLLSKAGEKTKEAYEKKGEVTKKEIVYGLACGAITVGMAYLGNEAVEYLDDNTEKIVKDLVQMYNQKVDVKQIRAASQAFIDGVEAGVKYGSFNTPEEIAKELEHVMQIDPNAKGEWGRLLKGTLTTFLTATVFTYLSELYNNRGYYSTHEERISKTPKENGEWTGERGESKFISYSDEVKEYLDAANIDGVDYKNGCPDFSPYSKGEVHIPNMSSERYSTMGNKGNFEQADAALAKLRGNGCTPRDVANWRKANGYTWHECNDMKTCQKVPSVINKVFRHLGGVSECKHKEEMLASILGQTSKGGIFDE